MLGLRTIIIPNPLRRFILKLNKLILIHFLHTSTTHSICYTHFYCKVCKRSENLKQNVFYDECKWVSNTFYSNKLWYFLMGTLFNCRKIYVIISSPHPLGSTSDEKICKELHYYLITYIVYNTYINIV